MIDCKIVALSSSIASPTEKVNTILRLVVSSPDLIANPDRTIVAVVKPYLAFDPEIELETEFSAVASELDAHKPEVWPITESIANIPETAYLMSYGGAEEPTHFMNMTAGSPVILKVTTTIPNQLGVAAFKVRIKWFDGATLLRTDELGTDDEVRDMMKIVARPLTIRPPKFPSRPVIFDFQSPAVAGKFNVLRGVNFGADLADLFMNGIKVPNANVSLWNDDQITFLLPRNISGNVIFTVRRMDIDLFSKEKVLEVLPIPNPEILSTSWVNNTAPKGVRNPIIIYGRNFQDTPGILSLSSQTDSEAFNPVVLSWTDNSIRAEIAETAVSGRLKVMTYEGLQSVEYQIHLGVTTPVIDRLVPNICNEGDLVAVIGSGFGDQAGIVKMKDSPVVFETVAWSDQCVVINAGYGIPSCSIELTTHDEILSNNKAIIINKIEQQPIPRISRVSPAGGPPGSLVKLMGVNFGEYSPQMSYCILGNTSMELTSGGWTDTEITARVSVAAKTNFIKVITNHGESNQAMFIVTDTPLPEDVVIQPKPSDNVVTPFIDEVNPKYQANAGSTLLIRGRNFGRAQGSVTLNGAALQILPGTWNMKAVQVVLPNTPQAGTIRIQNSLGVSNRVSYVVLDLPPKITSIHRNPFIPGQEITIYGENFGEPDPLSYIRTGVAYGRNVPPASIISWTDTAIRVATSTETSFISRRMQVIRGAYKSEWFEFELEYMPTGDLRQVPLSAGDIRNEEGQLVSMARDVNPVFANIPVNSPVVRNLNADKFQGKDWEDIKEMVDTKIGGQVHPGESLVSINNVRPDETGNIKFCAAGSLEIVPNNIDHEVIVSANTSDTQTASSGLVIEASGIHDIQAGDGLLVSRQGDTVLMSLDYGLGLHQVAPGEHSHGNMNITVTFE